MIKRSLAPVLLAVAALALIGCNDKKSNIKPPTELAKFTSTLEVKPLWHASIGRGAGDSGIRLAPIHADGRIYAASVDGEMAAIDATNGRTVWRKQRRWRDGVKGYTGGPSFDAGTLAMGTRDGEVLLLDAATGEERWRADVGAAVISPPLFTPTLVLARTDDGKITALKREDGSRAWRYDRGTVPALSLRGNGGMVLESGVVFFGSDDGKLVAIRADNGGPLWEHAAAIGEGRTEIQQLADADGTPLVVGTAVYLGAYQGELLAVDGPTGRPLWSKPFSTYTGLAGSGNLLIGVDAESNVWAFSDATGGDLWKQEGLAWRWLGAPAVMKSFVVVGDMKGYVHWLDLADGSFVARVRPSRDAIRSMPLVIDQDTVVIEDVHGRLTAYRIGAPAP